MFIQASTRMLLRGAMLIVLVIIAMPAGAQESAIPLHVSQFRLAGKQRLRFSASSGKARAGRGARSILARRNWLAGE